MTTWNLLLLALACGACAWGSRRWVRSREAAIERAIRRLEAEGRIPPPARLGDCPCDYEDEPCERCDPESPCDRFGHVIPREGGACLRPNCAFTPTRTDR